MVTRGVARRGRARSWIGARIGVCLAAACLASACGGADRDIHRAFNSRDVGPYLALPRAQGADGSLVVHVAAHQPEHAEQIARQIVRQNYAASVDAVRVVIDPASGDGERHVYRWDGQSLQVDASTEGLPPRAAPAEAHAAGAAH